MSKQCYICGSSMSAFNNYIGLGSDRYMCQACTALSAKIKNSSEKIGNDAERGVYIETYLTDIIGQGLILPERKNCFLRFCTDDDTYKKMKASQPTDNTSAGAPNPEMQRLSVLREINQTLSDIRRHTKLLYTIAVIQIIAYIVLLIVFIVSL